MNDRLLELLRAQQEQELAGQGGIHSSSMQQQMPQHMPQVPTEGTEDQRINPFDSGIKRAIESARTSMSMNNDQQHNAIRQAMLAFANEMSNTPNKGGFLNNLGDIGKALNPALQTYGNVENAALKENNNMANQILAHQMAERDRSMKEEDQAWRRRHMENQLSETARHHNLIENFKRGQQLGEQTNEGLMPFVSKSERNAYTRDYKGLSSVLKEIEGIKKSYVVARKDAEKKLFDPMVGVGKNVVKAENFLIDKFGGSKERREEKSRRDELKSRLNKFVSTSERALKGGVLGPQIIKLFKEQGIYPDYDDTPETFEAKLKMMEEEVANNFAAAKASLHLNAHVTPLDLATEANEQSSPNEEAIPQEKDNVAQQDSQDGMILMMDPTTGEQDYVPMDRVSEAVQDGLVTVE